MVDLEESEYIKTIEYQLWIQITQKRIHHLVELLNSVPDFNLDSSIFPHTGMTMMHYAASLGQEQTIQILAEAGASLNSRDQIMRTPLHFASSKGKVKCVIQLCNRQADINAITIGGETPLMKAAFFGHSEVVKVLFAYDCNYKLTNNLGQTAMQIASNIGNQSIRELLARNQQAIHVLFDIFTQPERTVE